MSLFNKSNNPGAEMGFMDHLEALRWHLVRSVIVVLVLGIVLFCFPDFVFGKIIFGPLRVDFITYRKLCELSQKLGGIEGLCVDQINFSLRKFLFHFLSIYSLGPWGLEDYYNRNLYLDL